MSDTASGMQDDRIKLFNHFITTYRTDRIPVVMAAALDVIENPCAETRQYFEEVRRDSLKHKTA